MSNKTDDKLYGFSPENWARLPEWLQTFVMESNERNANAHHAQHRQASQSLQDQAWKASDFVLKTLVAVEGGSLVAILAFLGSLTQRRSELDVTPLLWALGGLGGGLLLAIGASFCAYFVASHYAAGHDNRQISFSQPFVLSTAEGDAHDKIGERYRCWGIGLALASLLSASLGVTAFGFFTAKALSAPEQPAPASPVELVRTIQQMSEANKDDPQPAPQVSEPSKIQTPKAPN